MAARKPSSPRRECYLLGDSWQLTSSESHILKSQCYGPPCDKTVDDEMRCQFCRYGAALAPLPQWPEMVFADNGLRLEHRPSGAGIEFDALDALKLVNCHEDWVKVEVSADWKSARGDVPCIENTIKPFDWTFYSEYCGSFSDKWKISTTTERIDLERLKVKEPILFFFQTTLFEDELADNGCSRASVKCRAMPSGWFVLYRLYIRIDKLLVRVVDCRMRWETARPDRILREFSIRQVAFEDLTGMKEDVQSAFYQEESAGMILDLDVAKLLQEKFEEIKL